MAKEKLKGLDPESFCNKYGYDGEDVCMTDEAREKLFKLGAPIQPVNEDGDYEFGPEEMARIIVWFLNQGDPDLAVLHVSEDLPMLPFYGYDEKHRHIDFMGYGLF